MYTMGHHTAIKINELELCVSMGKKESLKKYSGGLPWWRNG